LNSFKFYVTSHGIEDMLLILFRKPGNIIEPLHHGGVFYEFFVFGISWQIAYGGVQPICQFFHYVNRGFYLISLIFASNGKISLTGLSGLNPIKLPVN